MQSCFATLCIKQHTYTGAIDGLGCLNEEKSVGFAIIEVIKLFMWIYLFFYLFLQEPPEDY